MPEYCPPDHLDADKRDVSYHVDLLTSGYLTAAYWTDGDGDNEREDQVNGEPLAPSAHREVFALCAEFYAANFGDLFATAWDLAGWERHGHDLWLTRNHHGAGFWDRGYGEVGDRLTTAAEVYGEAYLYLGGDGFAYFD